ncbi:MAG TPA: matrixin family metalloprotease [Candidatus Thermoplasmatota archaeon]|nr:matrixin family metalloprotease [Candidatus Thermoplasmatota archaeon]
MLRRATSLRGALVLLCVLLLVAPVVGGVSPRAQGKRHTIEACEPEDITYADPEDPSLTVVVGTVCAATADAETGTAPIADGCTSTAYALAGHRWDKAYTGRIDPRGSGLTETAVMTAFRAAATTWDAAAAATLFGGFTVGGDASKVGTRDGVNQIGFRNLGTTGVLGRTTTWFTSAGVAFESDAVYNTAYKWSTTGERSKADLQSVATHELGHAFGLDHAPTTTANACLTMYYKSTLGSTAQRTLGSGDLLGIQKKYGAPATATPTPFQATFTKHGSNTWWIEVKVTANLPLAGVTASVNGDAPVALAKSSWGTWSKSVYVPVGSTVVFTAKATDGQTARSAPMAWP